MTQEAEIRAEADMLVSEAAAGVGSGSGADTAAADASVAAGIGRVAVGEHVTFGTWRGAPIEWRVLDVQSGKALLLSEKVLAWRQFDGLEDENGERLAGTVGIYKKNLRVTWEYSEIREWLNDDFLRDGFLNMAFSSSEQRSILFSKIPNPDNRKYGTEGGADTEDKVFLLSLDEVDRYFADGKLYDTAEGRIFQSDSLIAYREASAEDEEYMLKIYMDDFGCSEEKAKEKIASWADLISWGEATRWWLRSPGDANNCAVDIDMDGFVHDNGSIYVNDFLGIRPAMWVQTD